MRKFELGATYCFSYCKFEERMQELAWDTPFSFVADYKPLDGLMFTGNGEIDYTLEGELIDSRWCTKIIL